jgi:hypothetical protein
MAETPSSAATMPVTAIAAAPACDVNFWTFAAPAMLGMLVSSGVGLLAKRYFNGDPAGTQRTAQLVARTGAFWFVAGFTWIAMSKKKGSK